MPYWEFGEPVGRKRFLAKCAPSSSYEVARGVENGRNVVIGKPHIKRRLRKYSYLPGPVSGASVCLWYGRSRNIRGLPRC